MSVSVIIPTYNRSTLVGRAIESALSQTYEDVEVIVVDDGSTDDTAGAVRRYGSSVRYVRQQNAGVSAARNLGIDVADGRYVAFLDSDDYWYDFKLSIQAALLNTNSDIGLVFSDFAIEKPGRALQRNGAARWAGRAPAFPEMVPFLLAYPKPGEATSWPADTIRCYVGGMYAQLLDELPMLTSSVVVRKSTLDPSIRFADQVSLFEDWEFFARVARVAPIGYMDVETTINVGHAHASGRLSHRDTLTRAQHYLGLIERVWLTDHEFVTRHPKAACSAHGRALLAVAKHALLAGQPELARGALAQWRALGTTERRWWAAVYAMCMGLPGGRGLLRNLVRGHIAASLLANRRRRPHGRVNPAA